MTDPDRQLRSELPLRTAAEREAMAAATYYASIHNIATPPETAFLEQLPEARLSILHRAVESLYRETPTEQVVDLMSPQRTDREDTFIERVSGLTSDDFQTIKQSLQKPHEWVVGFIFPGEDAVLVAAGSAIHGFDRYRATGPVVAWSPEGVQVIDHPVDLVQLLAMSESANQKATAELQNELAESAANLALARVAARTLQRKIPAETIENPVTAAAPTGTDQITALERLAAIEERPTNPSAKIRHGMTPTDALLYAPEFTDRVNLRFVAVSRLAAFENKTVDGQPVTAQLYSIFDGLSTATRDSIPPEAAIDEYAVIPVHPWQYYNTLRRRFSSAFASGDLIDITGFTRPATPLMNLRTLVPWTTGAAVDAPPHLKLPVNIKKTSITRTLEIQMIHNAPRMSDLLQTLLCEESFDSVGVLAAEAGVCYSPSGVEADSEPGIHAEQLSVITRMNPLAHSLVTEDTTPITAASLASVPPGHHEPLVCQCVGHIARSADRSLDEAAELFFDRYVEVTLPFQLTLNAKYGVKLQTHLQNMVIILDEEYLPTATLVRDLGDSRVYNNRLEEHGYSIEPYPDSDMQVSNLSEHLRSTMIGFFQLNLAELIGLIAFHTPVQEDECWAIVRDRAQHTFDNLREDDTIPRSWIEDDEAELFARKVIRPTRITGALSDRDVSQTRTVNNPLTTEFKS